mmetsp:Transcript_30129/g.87491  ORF Transcript_30129/g.87491 Transcript_30129/m.87491 type:complete len:274 (-) Transcript_30129:11-832(-)
MQGGVLKADQFVQFRLQSGLGLERSLDPGFVPRRQPVRHDLQERQKCLCAAHHPLATSPICVPRRVFDARVDAAQQMHDHLEHTVHDPGRLCHRLDSSKHLHIHRRNLAPHILCGRIQGGIPQCGRVHMRDLDAESHRSGRADGIHKCRTAFSAFGELIDVPRQFRQLRTLGRALDRRSTASRHGRSQCAQMLCLHGSLSPQQQSPTLQKRVVLDKRPSLQLLLKRKPCRRCGAVRRHCSQTLPELLGNSTILLDHACNLISEGRGCGCESAS